MIYMLIPRREFDMFDSIFGEPVLFKEPKSFDFPDHERRLMKTDVREGKEKFELVIDLPGFDKEDIKMHIEDGYLVINAKTSNETEEKDDDLKFVHRERFYGECTRNYYIGDDVKEEDIKASFKNGTLTIEVPKKDKQIEKQEKKYIEIL